MAKLNTEQMKDVIEEVKENNRELVNAIIRAGGDKEDYQRAYRHIKFGERLD